MEEKRIIICQKCQIELTEQKTTFHYLGNTFSAAMLKCPECGQVFISERIANGRMREIEATLESK